MQAAGFPVAAAAAGPPWLAWTAGLLCAADHAVAAAAPAALAAPLLALPAHITDSLWASSVSSLHSTPMHLLQGPDDFRYFQTVFLACQKVHFGSVSCVSNLLNLGSSFLVVDEHDDVFLHLLADVHPMRLMTQAHDPRRTKHRIADLGLQL